MQPTDILDLIIQFVLSPLFLFIILMIVCVGAARYASRSKSSAGMPFARQMKRMVLDIDKEREISEPAVQSRQEIITTMFESQMSKIGLKPSMDSGYIPVSYTPLARYLKERGVPDDTVDAILSGLMEEETEQNVRDIIDATAETPDVDLTGVELEKAKQLAVDEWRNIRGIKDV
ncbi:MAG: hypothetical protein ACFFCP_11290 [Promethearchaeota archaeon]